MTMMYKPDKLADDEFRLDISKVLHRQAGIRGFYCSPKRSHIQPGSYYAEVGQHTWEGREPYSGLVRPNLALGTGRTPTIAAMDGYRKVGLNDELMQAIYLEIETYYLGQAVKTYGKLEKGLDALFEALALGWGYQTRVEISDGMTPKLLTTYDEDDDL
jgi:hypothetical protein